MNKLRDLEFLQNVNVSAQVIESGSYNHVEMLTNGVQRYNYSGQFNSHDIYIFTRITGSGSCKYVYIMWIKLTRVPIFLYTIS